MRAEYGGKQYPVGNLSITGAFIRTREPLEADVGAELELRLVSERLAEPIELTAVLRRRERGHGIGVHFMRFRLQPLYFLRPQQTKSATRPCSASC